MWRRMTPRSGRGTSYLNRFPLPHGKEAAVPTLQRVRDKAVLEFRALAPEILPPLIGEERTSSNLTFAVEALAEASAGEARPAAVVTPRTSLRSLRNNSLRPGLSLRTYRLSHFLTFQWEAAFLSF